MSAVVLRLAGKEPIRLSTGLDQDVDPMLVIDAMRNLSEEVRDIKRITRIVRFRVTRLEDAARATKYPQNATRHQARADAYRVWLFHLELMTS